MFKQKRLSKRCSLWRCRAGLSSHTHKDLWNWKVCKKSKVLWRIALTDFISYKSVWGWIALEAQRSRICLLSVFLRLGLGCAGGCCNPSVFKTCPTVYLFIHSTIKHSVDASAGDAAWMCKDSPDFPGSVERGEYLRGVEQSPGDTGKALSPRWRSIIKRNREKSGPENGITRGSEKHTYLGVMIK